MNDERTESDVQPPGGPREVEETGRSVDEAVGKAIARLGVPRENVDIRVLDQGSRGVLGLGSRDARVAVWSRAAVGRDQVVRSVVAELIGLMGFPADISVQDTSESVRVEVAGDDLGPLIGKHGQTLASLEALVGLISGRRVGSMTRIEMDVMGYRERREAALQALARKTADRVARSGREIALLPMDARDRRIVHVALQDHRDVTTVSRGEGELRRVVVMPGAAGAAAPEEDHQPAAPLGKSASPGSRQGGDEGLRRTGAVERRSRSEKGGESAVKGRWSNGATGARGGPGERQFRSPKGPFRGRFRKPGGSGSGQQVPQGRPEGLPVDEELEAEIQAHLERIGRRETYPSDPPDQEGQKELNNNGDPASEDQG